MQFLEYPLIWEWCREHGVPLDESGESAPQLSAGPALIHHSQLVFAPEGPSGHEPAVAAALLRALGPWDECLLWVQAWGIWPSSEDWPRYYALRARYGERMSLENAPGHLATPADDSALAALLLQVLQSGWDAMLLITRAGSVLPRRIQVSHDGWVRLEASDPIALTVPGLAPPPA